MVFYIFLRPLPTKKLRKNSTMRIFIKTRQPRAMSWKGFPFVLFKRGCVQTRPYPLVLLDIFAILPPFLTSQRWRDWTSEMLPCPQVISRPLIWPRILHSFNNLLNPAFAIADWTCGMSWWSTQISVELVQGIEGAFLSIAFTSHHQSMCWQWCHVWFHTQKLTLELKHLDEILASLQGRHFPITRRVFFQEVQGPKALHLAMLIPGTLQTFHTISSQLLINQTGMIQG